MWVRRLTTIRPYGNQWQIRVHYVHSVTGKDESVTLERDGNGGVTEQDWLRADELIGKEA